MGQNWYLVNVDTQEKNTEVAGSKLGEVFFDKFFYLYISVTVPCIPKEVDQWLANGRLVLQPGPLGKLSSELLDMIFGNLERTKDIVRLAITCKMMLSISKRHILRGLQDLHAPWADCRLICIGDEYNDDNLPTGMLTKEEREEILTTYIPGFDDARPDENINRFSLFACEMYDYVYPRYSWNGPIASERQGLNEAHRQFAGDPVALRDVNMVATITSFGGVPTYPPDDVAVLCNLSKSEYVRKSSMPVLEKGRYKLNLCHALLSRICWSDDPSISMACKEKYNNRLVRGSWAGDRFRITTVGDMPAPRKGTQWKDVTEEVNKMLRHLWKHDMEGEPFSESEDEGTGEEEKKP